MLSILFLASTAAAYAVPSSKPQSQSPFPSVLSQKCTFVLFHKQLCPTSIYTKAKTNYILLPNIYDHTNSLTIDVALQRSRESFHSYIHVSQNLEFAVEGLLDDTALNIKGEDGKDEVAFEYDGLAWTSGDKEEGEAWCEVEEWDAGWETCGDEESVNPRERKMHCAFPCEAAVEEEQKIRIELL